MSQPDPSRLTAPLLAWFRAGARPLPWRATRDPYRVLVSEVMLQQTRVETVLRYYEPFLERFPTLEALAAADEEEVLAAWSGLGYYRRARNLHRAAREASARFGGRLPRDPEGLGSLPGIGRYTVGAVLSIAHDARLPILDGNVTRVLSRVFRVAGDPARAAVRRRLWALATEVLPEQGSGDLNQALMELGATVCRPQAPACERCPIAQPCAGRARGDATAFPAAGRQVEVPVVERAAVLLARPDGAFALVKRPAEGLLAGLWELPARDLAPGEDPAASAAALLRALGVRAAARPRGTTEHRFTHRHWVVRTFAATTRRRAEPLLGRWVRPGELARLGIPTVTRKVLAAAREGPDGAHGDGA